jgi:hydrogenase expression/formation protein HypC
MCLGVPGRVITRDARDAEFPTAVVEFAGVRREVSLACVAQAQPGDYVLVHAGIALSLVDPDEAQRVFEWLRRVEPLDEVGT